MIRIGIIGGTGIYRIPGVAHTKDRTTNRYGTVEFARARIGERELLFIPRHGEAHTVPPHKVGYRANIWALRELEACAVLATASVGSLNPDMEPGSLVVLDQFLDFTKQRVSTFFHGEGGEVRHTDFTQPYCERLRQALIASAEEEGATHHSAGTYLCAEGPRFETPAEIRMFRQWGADVVGMTNVPEVVLAREAGLSYAAVAIVANWAAGIPQTPLSHEEVSAQTERYAETVSGVLLRAAQRIEDVDCPCRHPFPKE